MKPRASDANLDAILAGGAVVAGVCLGILAGKLASAPPTRLDRRVQRQVLDRTTRRQRRLALVVSGPGYPGAYFPATAALIWALRRRGALGAEPLAIASIGGWATHRLIKLFVSRRRPRSMRGRKNEFEAFPSGHTTATTAIALTAAYVLARQNLVSVPVAMAIGSIVPVAVGASRVVSDEHWTTDVIGGWIGGAGMAALAAMSLEHSRR